MSNTSTVKVADNGLLTAFRNLSLEGMREVGVKAFGEALPIIRDSAEGVLSSTGINIDSIGKAGKTMREGITMKVYDDGSGGSISALGEYKLKWFATGTNERWQDVKHGSQVEGQAHRYLGAIQPTHFITRGAEQVEEQFYQRLEDIISESIARAIE